MQHLREVRCLSIAFLLKRMRVSHLLVGLLFAACVATAADDDSMVSKVVDVSPKELDALTREGKLVFLALYVPSLPKWTNHMLPTIETIADHFDDNENVIIARANCKKHKVSG